MIAKTQSSSNTLLIALALAVVVHVSLLLIKFGANKGANLRAPTPLTIHLQQTIEASAEPSIEEVEVSAVKFTEPPKDVVTRSIEIDEEEQKIEEQNVAIYSKPLAQQTTTLAQQTTTATIINSTEFKEWIKSETSNHIKNNPESLVSFADSFVLPVEETPPDIETQVSPLATGLTDIRRKGKLTCQLQMKLPFQNDFNNGLIITTRDCTPAKKFTLDTR